MNAQLTRRDLMQQAGYGTAALTLGGLARGAPALASHEPDPKLAGWVPHTQRMPIVTGDVYASNHARFWITMLQVSSKNLTVTPSGNYYLWAFSHDQNECHLFSAASPYGPWSYQGLWQQLGTSSRPAPPSGYNAGHFTSGAVAWDPQTRYFYCIPHSARGTGANYNRWQETFILRSRDGRNWEHLRTGPIIPCGGSGSYDQFHTGYGRFLTDPYGNIVRPNGLIHIFYRGVALDATGEILTMAGAYSSDFVNWNKHATNPLFRPNPAGNFHLGTAWFHNAWTTLMYQMGPGNSGVPVFYMRKSSQTNLPFTAWNAALPATPFYEAPAASALGPSYVIHNNQHFMAYPAVNASLQYEVHLATAV